MADHMSVTPALLPIVLGNAAMLAGQVWRSEREDAPFH
jgi:hypothetical protein